MSWAKTKNNIFFKIKYTLRGKLSFLYFTTIGIIVILFSISVSVLLWFTLQDQIDHHVHIVVNEASQIVQKFQDKQRDELIKNLVSGKGMTVIVLSPDGAPVLETNSPDIAFATEHQLQEVLASSSLFETEPVHFTNGNIRFAAMPVQVNAGKGIVAVGYSTQILYSTFFKMLGIGLGTMVLIVVPTTILGYIFLKKQLSPLESIALQAKSITNTSSLSRRMKMTSSAKELTTIRDALNTMLDKLDKIFKNERKFFSDAAHTLKTPLAVLRSQIENSDISSGLSESLLKNIDTTNDTIADLLFLSKISAKPKNIKSFSLSCLMNNLFELASTLGEDKGLKVSADIQANIEIVSDEKLLQKALGNIVINSVYYNKSKGEIFIRLKKSQEKIVVVVKDTGIGIPKKDLVKVFKRFFRSSNTSVNGSGLGLSISKAVIESLGGNIFIKSTLKQGTSVFVSLPMNCLH